MINDEVFNFNLENNLFQDFNMIHIYLILLHQHIFILFFNFYSEVKINQIQEVLVLKYLCLTTHLQVQIVQNSSFLHSESNFIDLINFQKYVFNFRVEGDKDSNTNKKTNKNVDEYKNKVGH